MLTNFKTTAIHQITVETNNFFVSWPKTRQTKSFPSKLW